MTKKTVLITGCSSGFGKLSAKTFAKSGWNVVATMRSPERDDELKHLDGVLVTALDVTDPQTVAAAVNVAIERFGSVDVLVNNAGFGGHTVFEQATDEAIRAMFETNVFGVMNVTRAVLPHMRRQKAGCVINVSSVSGMLGSPTTSIYNATKFAIQGFTEALAFEYAPLNIKAKTVAPGAFSATGFNANVKDNLTAGDAELVAHATRLREALRAAIEGSNPDGTPQDPQIVADKIFECATADTPIHNPVGADAEALMGMMDGVPRQQFLDGIAGMLDLGKSDAS